MFSKPVSFNCGMVSVYQQDTVQNYISCAGLQRLGSGTMLFEKLSACHICIEAWKWLFRRIQHDVDTYIADPAKGASCTSLISINEKGVLEGLVLYLHEWEGYSLSATHSRSSLSCGCHSSVETNQTVVKPELVISVLQ